MTRSKKETTMANNNINDTNHLKIISWNAQSLNAHNHQLKYYINNTPIKPHIICIQETWLKQNSKFTIAGYNIESKCREKGQGGGVATFIRQGIQYGRKAIHDDVEAVVIETFDQTRTAYTIVNLYIPPLAPINNDHIDALFNLPNTIITGDVNAKNTLWGAPKNDARGRHIENLIEDNNLVTLNTGRGTRLNNDGSYSHLDICATSSQLSLKGSWSIIDDDEWGSDHLPTKIEIGLSPIQEEPEIKKYKLKKADWKKYKEICKEEITHETIQATDKDAYDKIAELIKSAADRAIPNGTRRRHKKMLPYWNEHCKEAIRLKRKAKRRMMQTRSMEDCMEFRKTKSATQRTVRTEQQKYWKDYCSTINDTTKNGAVWRMSKKMLGTNSNRSIPTIVTGGQKCVTNTEKAEAIARSISKGSSNSNFDATFMTNKKTREENRITQEKKHDNNNEDGINSKFIFHELDSALRRCKKEKSAGEDQLPYELLQHLPKCSKKVLLEIINEIWREGKLPKKWKHSLILPFPKEGKDPTDPESYRPIALTTTICKVMERLISDRLAWHMESKNLFNKDQTGFRKHRNTIDQVMRICSDINDSINTNRYTIGIFIDLKKAFDMLWKTGILEKMESLGITGRIYRWVKDFMEQRTFQVKIGDKLSNTYDLENGVPQGSVVSPLLFLLAVNDFPEMTDNVKKSIFADDSSIWTTGKNLEKITKHIQKAINKIEKWSALWGFSLSKEKTSRLLPSM